MPTIPIPHDLAGRVAIVTGANHGIRAETARVLARCGAKVLLTYLRLDDPPDAGTPERYGQMRRSTAEDILAAIRDEGGEATAIEADLADERSHAELFDEAEQRLGPVEIDAACMLCGETDPVAFHHLARRNNDEALEGPLCLNCHAKAHEALRDGDVSLIRPALDLWVSRTR